MARNGCSSSKISVWWDIENCHVPRNVDPHYIAQNLRSALHHANLNGPITIDVFGDTRNFEHKTLEALSSTGVTINHIPSGNKDAADKAILVAMLFWALDNPPPAHFLLISGDGDFANALHRLRLKGYDILLARPDQPVKPALLGAATNIWYWTNVAKGQVSVPEEVKKTYEESAGMLSRFSTVSTDEGVQKVNQRAPPFKESERPGKVISSKVCEPHHPKNETNNCSSDDTQLSNSERAISPKLAAHPWVFTNSNTSDESMKRFDGGPAQLEPKLQADANPKTKSGSHTPISSAAKQVEFSSSKQPYNTGYQPTRSGHDRTELSRQSYDEREKPFVSSNKIANYAKGPLASILPTLTVAGHLPGLSKDAQRVYNSNIPKVMKTFEVLKLDGLVPTQGNMQDCLCYWDKQHVKVNLKQVLDQAVNLQHIAKVSVGERDLTYFLPHNTDLWKCVNIGDMRNTFSNELWKDFYEFLCCSKNWQFFVHSQSMYEAAARLKNNGHNGIRKLAVGEIIQFLNQAVRNKNWLSLEMTPTFLLSIRSQVVIKQNPSDRMMSPSSMVPEPDKDVFDISTKLFVFQKLKTWLQEVSQTRPDYDVSLVPKDFELATGIRLDILKLGFARLQELIEEFDDVVTIKIARKGLKILCPVVNKNKFKSPTFDAFEDKQQKSNLSFENTDMKQPLVTTKSVVTSSDKEKQSLTQPPGALTSQRTGASPSCFHTAGPSAGASQNFSPESLSSCVATAPKDVAQQVHLPPLISNNAEALQNSSLKATARNHPSLKKLRSWLLQLPSLKHGYDLSLIKKDFHQATGIVLDPQSLGYSKVKDILKEFSEDFYMESPRQGLYLLFANSKSRTKPNAGSTGKQSSGHVEVPSKPAQKAAVNKASSMQWKESLPTVRISDGESSMKAEANSKAVVATSSMQH